MTKRKKIIIIVISIIMLFVLVGGGVGIYILVNSHAKAAEIPDTEAKYSTSMQEAPKDGTDPSSYSVEENVAYALWTVSNTNEFYTVTTGSAKASRVTQSVYNKRVVKGDKAMVTMISNGVVKNAKQRYFLPDKVFIRDGVKINSDSDAKWSQSEPECVSYKTIISRYGWLPFDVTGYIICHDTYINFEDMSMTKNDDGTYTLSFDLDPDGEKAPFWYRREVRTNGDSQIIPQFYSIHFEMTINSNWQIVTNTIQESYKVKSMGIEAVTKTKCTESFYYENVEFDSEALAYFDKYSYMSALDDSEEKEETIDPASIIIGSLQNEDGSDIVLDLELSCGDFKENGVVALNISNLPDVKVLASIGDLYVEYTDSIYISLGGVKVKANIDELTSIISKITDVLPKGDGDGLAVDTSELLKQLSASTIEESDNKVIIDSKLTISDIEIPLHFLIEKDGDNYILKEGYVSVDILGKRINIYVKKSTKSITTLDHNSFMNLSNIEFVVDDIVTIINNKSLDLELNATYMGLDIKLAGTIDFSESIKASFDASLKKNDKELKLELDYLDDELFLSFKNVKLKISKDDLLRLIKKYGGDSVSITTEDLLKIDIEKVLTTVFSIDYDSLLKELIITNDSLDLTIGLNEIKETLDEFKLSIKDTEYGLSGYLTYSSFNLGLKLGDLSYELNEIDKTSYNNLAYLEGIIDDCLLIFNEKKLVFDLEANYKDFILSGNGILDFTDDIAFYTLLKLKDNDNEIKLELTYKNDIIYLEVGNTKLKITKDDLLNIISKFSDINLDSVKLDINSILDILFSIDYDKLIEKLVIEEDLVDVSLDLSSFIAFIGKVSVKVKEDKGIKLDLSLLDSNVSLSVKSTKKKIVVLDNGYINLGYLDGFIDDILAIYNSKKLGFDLDLTYNEIKVLAKGIIDFESDIKLDLDLELIYDNAKLDVEVIYLDNVFYLSYGKLNFKLDINDLKTLISEYGNINLDLNMDLNVESIIKTILSLDLDNMLKSLDIQENLIGVELDLSNFIDALNKVTITLDRTNDLKLSLASSSINLDASIYNTDKNITLSDKTYYDLMELETTIDKLISLIDSGKMALDLKFNYKDLDIDLDGTIEFKDSLKLDLDVLLTYNSKTYNIDLTYIEDTLYLSFYNVNLSITKDDLLKIVSKFSDIKLDSNIDVKSILKTIVNIDLDKLIDELTLTNNTLSLKADLSAIKDDLKELSLILKEDNGISLDITYMDFLVGLKVIEANKEITKPEGEFNNLGYLDGILDDVLVLYNKKKLELDIFASYKDIDLEGNALLDFNSNIKAKANLTVKYQNVSIPLTITYIDDTVYLSLYDINLKVTKEELVKIIDKFSNNNQADSILDKLLAIDFSKLIESLVITDDKLEANININEITDKLGQIFAIVESNNGINLHVTLKDILVDLSVKETEEIITLDSKDYNDLALLDGILDDILVITDSKKLDINLSLTYKNIDINVSGLVDFNTNVKANAKIDLTYNSKTITLYLTYIDNSLYLTFNDINLFISKEDLEDVIGIFTTDSNSSILDKILSLDFEKVIKSFKILENDLNITLGLGDLISILDEISIEIKKDTNLSLIIQIIDLFEITSTISSSDSEVTLVANNYQNLGKLKGVITLASTLIDTKKLELDIDLKYKDLVLGGNLYLDFNDALNLYANLKVSYKTFNTSLDIYYLDSYKDLTKVILVDLGNNHVLIPLESIMANTKEINIDDLISYIFSVDFAKVLVALVIEDDSLDLTINLSTFDILKDLIDLTNNIKLSVLKDNDTITLKTNDIIDLNVNILESSYDIDVKNYEYINLNTLVNDVFELVNWINYESFRISLDGNVNIKSITLDLDGYIDFILDNKDYIINGYIHLLVSNTEHDIYIKYMNNTLYLEYGGLAVGLDISDISKLVKDIMTTLELTDSIDFDFGKLNQVLDTLAIDSDSISVDLSSIVDIISNLCISFNYINDLTKFDLAISGGEINIDSTIANINPYTVTLPNSYLDNDDLLSICKTVRRILDIIEKREFDLNIDLSVYDSGTKYLDVLGELGFIIDIPEGEKFSIDSLSFKINLSIKEYTPNGSVKVTHNVDIKWVNDYIYIIYSTKANSYLRFMAKKDSILSAIASLTEVMGLDLEFLNEYLQEEIKYVDFTQLTDLFTKDSKLMNISSIINSVNVKEDGISATIAASILNDKIPNSKEVLFDLTTNDSIPLMISLSGLYSDYVSESEYKRIDINSITLTNDSVTISAPSNTSSYYDLSEIDMLLNGLLTTGSNKDYAISSTVVLNLLGILKPEVKIDARVRVLEDGSPLVYMHMGIPSAGVSVGSLDYKITKKDTYIYYKDEYVYIYRVDNNGDTYKLKITYEEFFSDIVYYLLDFAMGMPDGIMSKINSATTDENYVIDAGSVINSYSYNNHQFNINLDMESLTGNSNLGDMAFTLKLTNVGVLKDEDGKVYTSYALTDITNFSMSLVGGFVTIESTSIGLTNTKLEEGYKWFTTINMDDVYNYIDSYTYGVDMIYVKDVYKGKRNHTVTFVMNYLDPVIYSGQAGMPIKFPNIDIVSYDDKHYAFDGWYLDKYLTEPFTDTIISNKSIKVYAKFREVNSYKLYINSIDGNNVYDVYDGVNLNSYLEKSVYTAPSGKTYRLLGYSLSEEGSIIDVSVMPKSDYTLYAIWKEMEYKLYVDGEYFQTLNESSTISLTGDYELKAGDIYFGFDSSLITYDTLVNMYGNYAIINGNEALIYLETKTNRLGYYTISFEYDYNKFNYKRYNSVSLRNDMDFDSSLLPNGLYNDMNINYWFNDDVEYYSGNISSILHENTTLYAYYATCNYLSYGYDSSSGENLFSVVGFDYTGSQNITIVLPKYVEYNGEYKVVKSLAIFGENDEKYSAFSSKTNIYAIYFNEGFEVIGANAFKNASSLTKVYLSSTVKTVEKDAFYMASKDDASKVRFYLSQSSTLSTSGWYGFKSSGSYKNYGTKDSGFLGIGSYDLSNAFNHYNGRIENIIHALY